MIINDILFILLRRVRPEAVIRSFVESNVLGTTNLMCMFPEQQGSWFETMFVNAMQNEFVHYTVDEARYSFAYAKGYELDHLGGSNDFGIFGLIAKAVENILITDSNNECLCKQKCILEFRNLAHPISPTIFMAAHLAKHDIIYSIERTFFSWNPIVRSNSIRLQRILDKGVAENHFHIGGSSNAFDFSWICLMNHFGPDRKKEFEKENSENDPLDTKYSGLNVSQESDYVLSFKAACIRLFLYLKLNDRTIVSLCGNEPSETGASCEPMTKDMKDHDFNDKKWLLERLSLDEEECDFYMDELCVLLQSMRSFCKPVDESGFIPDYALENEPIYSLGNADKTDHTNRAVRDYERCLFRPLAGEQRFLYQLFKAVFSRDDRIIPYLDVAYAYLLIFCRVRGELIQVNDRIGFGNFQKYQDRKSLFTASYPMYETMRTGIAERIVLENPQIVSFEGRFCPLASSEQMIAKVGRLINLGTKPIEGVFGLTENKYEESEKRDSEYNSREAALLSKMHFVVHFPKRAQWIGDDETKEMISPRDSKVRYDTMLQANAILEARKIAPEVMKYVTGIDACSNEIDCRPEVFACAIRKICQHRIDSDIFQMDLPVMRVTYHAGEDFLDPIGGLRAIDEAILYCCMTEGDRLGHALALGVDCEEWYAQKGYCVLCRSQELLDNLVWLHGKMHQYDINLNSAENFIGDWFGELYSQIYLNNLTNTERLLYTVDIEKYFASLSIRGNDPYLYFHNPETDARGFEQLWLDIEPWRYIPQKVCGYEPVTSALFHHYHFNYLTKKESDRIQLFEVPKAIVEAVCEVQRKMRYEIARKNIAVECNPSSNYLIGSFKDYIKHPIFQFNNSQLFPSYDLRSKECNPYLFASINTDDSGIFDTSLENEYALIASSLEKYNDTCPKGCEIPMENIYAWLDHIRSIGRAQIFKRAADYLN